MSWYVYRVQGSLCSIINIEEISHTSTSNTSQNTHTPHLVVGFGSQSPKGTFHHVCRQVLVLHGRSAQLLCAAGYHLTTHGNPLFFSSLSCCFVLCVLWMWRCGAGDCQEAAKSRSAEDVGGVAGSFDYYNVPATWMHSPILKTHDCCIVFWSVACISYI